MYIYVLLQNGGHWQLQQLKKRSLKKQLKRIGPTIDPCDPGAPEITFKNSL